MKKLKIMKGSRAHRCALCLLLIAGACDGAAPADAPPDAKKPSAAGSDGSSRATRDHGNATVTLDGTAWAAERCTARIKPDDGGERLSLSCSRTTSAGGTVQREEIALALKGYAGAGDYTSAGNSHFARVAVDTKTANAAPDEGARAEVVTDSIAGAKVVNLAGARVTITAVGEAAIDGTFAWSPEPGKEGPSLTDGAFHAVVKR